MRNVMIMLGLFAVMGALLLGPIILSIAFANPLMTVWWLLIIPFVAGFTKFVVRRVYPNAALTKIEQRESHFVVSVVDTKNPDHVGTVAFDL